MRSADCGLRQTQTSGPVCLQPGLTAIQSKSAARSLQQRYPEHLFALKPRTVEEQLTSMSIASHQIGAVPDTWTKRHLLSVESLTVEEINLILDTAVMFKEATNDCREKISVLTGRTCANLFFEPSTRTKTSFALAARRLGADTVDFSASGSSLSKGETFIDTARNIEAMGVDAVIVRHQTPGTPQLLAQNLNCTVINAGDGAHEHPTQGLLGHSHHSRAPR